MSLIWTGLTVGGVGDNYAVLGRHIDIGVTDDVTLFQHLTGNAYLLMVLFVGSTFRTRKQLRSKLSSLTSLSSSTKFTTATLLVPVLRTPPNVITRADSLRIVEHILVTNKVGPDKHEQTMRKMTKIIDNSLIEKRYSCQPIGWLKRNPSRHARHVDALEKCIQLGVDAVQAVIQQHHIDVREVGTMIVISSCVKALPSIGRSIATKIGCVQTCIVNDITDVGCGAGAIGLTRATQHAVDTQKPVILLSVETPTYMFSDKCMDTENLIKCILFGDAAVACVVLPSSSPSLPAHEQVLVLNPDDAIEVTLPDTRHYAYCQPHADGDGRLHFAMTTEVSMVLGTTAPLIRDPFGTDRLKDADMIAHVGGPRLLPVLQTAIGEKCQIVPQSLQSFRDVGNIVSASVLDSLRRAFNRVDGARESSLIVSIGPGFTCSAIMGKWQ
jgi:predicted naringenin-chalcone synthase